MIEEVTLHNIISLSLAEEKLAKNFTAILARLELHDRRLNDLSITCSDRHQNLVQQIERDKQHQHEINQQLQQDGKQTSGKLESINLRTLEFQQETVRKQEKTIFEFVRVQERLDSIDQAIDKNLDKINDNANRIVQQKLLGQDLVETLTKKADRTDFQSIRKEFKGANEIAQKKMVELFDSIEKQSKKMKEIQDFTQFSVAKLEQHEQTLDRSEQVPQNSISYGSRGRGSIHMSLQRFEQIDYKIQTLTQQVNKDRSTITQELQEFENKFDELKKVKYMVSNLESQNRIRFAGMQEKANILGLGFNQIQFRVDAFQQEIIKQRKIFQEAIHQLNNLKSWISELNIRKIGEHIKKLQVDLTIMRKDTQVDLEKKVDVLDLKEKLLEIKEIIARGHDDVRKKADETSVKKALMFLQTRLKELIEVMMTKQKNQTESIVMKKGFFCLSCDRAIKNEIQGDHTFDAKSMRFAGSGRIPKGQFGLQNKALNRNKSHNQLPQIP